MTIIHVSATIICNGLMLVILDCLCMEYKFIRKASFPTFGGRVHSSTYVVQLCSTSEISAVNRGGTYEKDL